MRYILVLLLGASLLALAPPGDAGGGKEPTMLTLWPDNKDAGIFVYFPPADKATGAAVVICPGGGYGGLAMSYEGHDVARWLNSLGVAGIVLKYRHAPKYQHPIPMQDAQRAIRTVRWNADPGQIFQWKIDPERVGILGFSAGGHLASTAGTHFDTGAKDAEDFVERESCRPDFMILVYPVITLSDPHTHKGSRQNLLGKQPEAKLIELLSNEMQVSAKTPPTFLAHTSEDTAVPPQNSVMFYEALVKNKVPAEMHIYEKGSHGLGMDRRPDLPFSSWTKRCAAWMEGRGILARAK